MTVTVQFDVGNVYCSIIQPGQEPVPSVQIAVELAEKAAVRGDLQVLAMHYLAGFPPPGVHPPAFAYLIDLVCRALPHKPRWRAFLSPRLDLRVVG